MLFCLTYINGLLGIYELNRTELLSDVFIWAYERSCLRYSATRQTLGDPDPLRIRYRELRKEIVLENDQMRFIESIEIELMSLHKGNIARYRLCAEEYDAWQKTWA